MKTVPSLVASSTVGIAAAGLALGRPENSTPIRPTSRKRKVSDLAGIYTDVAQDSSSPIPRPKTTGTVITPDSRHAESLASSPANLPPIIHQRPTTTRGESVNGNGSRRWSIARHMDPSSPQQQNGEDTKRDSVSSRGSWMRRLSVLPISQSSSPRSSVGPDSPSIALSNDSAAPALPVSGTSTAPTAPNKLVKRAPSDKLTSSVSRSGSKSQVPTLRRPATSRQRSATLHQKFRDHSMEFNDQFPIPPLKSSAVSTPPNGTRFPALRPTWRPYFESKPTRMPMEMLPGRSIDGSTHAFLTTSRRVISDENVKPFLVQPEMITTETSGYTAYYDDDNVPDDRREDGVQVGEGDLQIIDTPSDANKRPRRSLSMNFNSPGWGLIRSGSLRGNKRNAEGRVGGKRISSAPVSTTPARAITSHGPAQSGQRPIPVGGKESLANTRTLEGHQRRSRNLSSPLPPLSRLSSFNVDLARLGLSSSSSSGPRRSPNSPPLHTQTTATSFSSPGNSAPTSPLYFGAPKSNPRTSEAADCTSTLVDSETDGKGFGFGDDDDTDFQSETVYDSLRSGTTGSIRSHNAHLEAMFDESPPSLVAAKGKRLSIHELLHGMRDGSDRIIEEDEGMSTPVKGARSHTSQDANLQTPVRNQAMNLDDSIKPSPPSFSLASKDFGRLSLDDEEEDEDWTRDDENLEIASLSPPSSSLNSRRVSASFRAALADLTNSSSTNGVLPSIERPKSNLFDWSEPSPGDKLEYMGKSSRPKTANVKQSSDVRGGRIIGRRGPNAAHVRSQSVPVVPDVTGQREHSKLAPKFGTWGLGGKGVSEEWDGDFDFENSANDTDQGDANMESSGMFVPPAIQASQQQIVGHVGQIREVCLLVDDLKRLRLLGREKNLLDGESAHLWTEAEGIIALAVPDEEDPSSTTHSPSSSEYGLDMIEDQHEDSGPDAEDLETFDSPFEVLNRQGRSTGFMYDGSTIRRRSVLSPGDDIFGPGNMFHAPAKDSLQTPSNSPRHAHKASSEYARSVMETMHQHRVVSDPLLPELSDQSSNKMPFDTTSLRDLVNRANVLSRQLSDIIRKADGSDREASPAVLSLTRAFTPTTESKSPVGSPKNLPRSQSNNSMLNGVDASPTRALGQRMHMMTVV